MFFDSTETGGMLRQSTDCKLWTTSPPATSAVDLRLNLISFFLFSLVFGGDTGKLIVEFGSDVSVGTNDVCEVKAETDSIRTDVGDGTLVDGVGLTNTGLPDFWDF